MSETMKDYFDALARLKKANGKINNDTVAIEAGRKKGSIKRSRPQFAALIAAIDEAASEVAAVRNEPVARLERSKDEKRLLQQRLEESLEREICLVRELFDLRRENAQLKSGKVLPLRRKPPASSPPGE